MLARRTALNWWRLLLAYGVVGAPSAATTQPAADRPASDASIADTLRLSPSGVAGTLLLPSGARPVGRIPIVLMISGSGPTDRDGNSAALPGRNNSLRLLAEALAARGMATLRYDKRGVGASHAALAREGDLTIDSLVTDAVTWANRLGADPRFGPIFLLGHSEGSLIALRAARQVDARGVISVAGLGRPANQVLREQLQRTLPVPLFTQADTVISTLANGHDASGVAGALQALFRPSVQPYLRSWFRYDPAAEIRQLTVPVLIAQGTADLQVGTSEARRLASAARHPQLAVVPAMNHVLKLVGADTASNLRAYADSTLPVAPALIDAVTAFVHRVAGAPPQRK